MKSEVAHGTLRATIALVAHSVRRARMILLAMVVVLSLVQVAFTLAADTMQKSGTFSGVAALLPSFVRQMFGDALAGFLSYTGMVAFGYFHPIIIAALVGLVIALATEPVADIESRFLDLVLARPLPRAAVVARSALLVTLTPAIVAGVMVAATLLSLRLVASPGAPVPPPALVATIATNLWALVACCGAAALAVAVTCRRRATATGISGLVLVVLFLADYLARVWNPAVPLARFSPFHYFDAMAIVLADGAFPASHVTLLLAAAGVAIAVAFLAFARRDL